MVRVAGLAIAFAVFFRYLAKNCVWNLDLQLWISNALPTERFAGVLPEGACLSCPANLGRYPAKEGILGVTMKTQSLTISSLFWITGCAACFSFGWLLPPPSFELKNGSFVSSVKELHVLEVRGDRLGILGGSDDGLVVGQKLGVVRYGKKITVATVTRVDFDLAVCRAATGADVYPGDRVIILK